jgi:hypothetical protein
MTILTAAKINSTVFCYVTPFSLVDRYQVSEDTSAFNLYCPEDVGSSFLRNASIYLQD